MSKEIPEIDIYDWHGAFKHPAFKEYFGKYNKDDEYKREDFIEREMMRRAIYKKALTTYIKDLTAWNETDWENDRLPGGCSNDQFSKITFAWEVVDRLHVYFLRLPGEEKDE